MGVNLLKKDEGLLFSITSNFYSIWGQLSYIPKEWSIAHLPREHGFIGIQKEKQFMRDKGIWT